MERSRTKCLKSHIKFYWNQSPGHWSAKQGYCAVNKLCATECFNFVQSHNKTVSNAIRRGVLMSQNTAKFF